MSLRLVRLPGCHPNQVSNSRRVVRKAGEKAYPTQSANSFVFGTVADSSTIPI